MIIQNSLIIPQKNSKESGKKGKTWKSGDTDKKKIVILKNGPDSHEFRQAESKRSLDYYYKKKNKKAQAIQGNASDEVVDITEDVDPDQVEITDPSEWSKELSCQRYQLKFL